MPRAERGLEVQVAGLSAGGLLRRDQTWGAIMVTARFASRSDARTAAELGSLLQLHTLIQTPRWRAEAMTELAPVLRRFQLPATGTPASIAMPRLLPRHVQLVGSIPFDDGVAALKRIGGIKERSLRAGALLRLVHQSIDSPTFAHEVAIQIEPMLFRQRALLAVARGCFERGRITSALRLARQVRDHRVAAERQLLLGEIRLAVRPASEDRLGAIVTVGQLRDARPAPAWTQLAEEPDVACRQHLMMATGWIRLGLRIADPDAVQRAVWHLHDAGWARPARRCFLAMLERSHVIVEDALLAMRTAKRAGIVDPYLAEHVAVRGEQLADAPAAFVHGLTGATSATADARSLERALFDEGVALSPAAPRRRRVLIATAQTCLRSALRDPQGWSRDVIDTRLRTLVHLGGTLGADAIAKALATLPVDATTFARAIEALAALDAKAAARLVLARGDLAGRDRLLHIIELRGGVPRGFTHALRRVHRTLAERQLDAAAWLIALADTWQREVGGMPDAAALEALATCTTIPSTPRALCHELDAAGAVVLGGVYDRVVAKVAAQPAVLDALLIARPARVDSLIPRWNRLRWTVLLKRVAARPDFVERGAIARAERLTGLSYAQLRTGELPVERVRSFAAAGARYRLRLLDKRLDLLTYLRFADVATRNCFRSSSRYYRERDVIDVWHDPLTFCFHVEREREAAFVPCGFFFGNFVEIASTIGVVVNSLHVRPRTAAVRAATLAAFEAAFCAPLGITRIGVANVHGGRGPLPSSYVQRAETFTRLRALARGKERVTTGYDDISTTFNKPITVTDLYWRA